MDIAITAGSKTIDVSKFVVQQRRSNLRGPGTYPRAPINPYEGSIPEVGKKAHFRACVVGGAHPQSGHDFRAFTMRGDGESPLFGHGQIQPPATKIVYFANYLLFTTLY